VSASAYLVNAGEDLHTHLRWCNDSGANRHISGDLSDFIPGSVRAINLTITVAKAGITMAATGVGDCDLHVFDQHGKAATIRLKDVLYVPGAAKNLLSTYCLGQQGYQFVADAVNPKFPPGLHFPAATATSDRYVVLHQVQNLSYIATRSDLHDTSGRMLTRANKYVVWHRKLGYMPMATLRKTKQCVTGLEDLTDAHFPGNDYSDPAVKIGKLQHADKPESASSSALRPLDCISWDTLGPMHYKSHHGHSYATIFTCARSKYTWVYNHASTADIPALL
jgi:hypothetical protein